MSRQQVYQWPVKYRHEAQQMRQRGRSYQTIASALAARYELGYLSLQTVRNWVKKEMYENHHSGAAQ